MKNVLLLAAATVLLSACGTNNSETVQENEGQALEMVEVEIQAPDSADPDQTIVLSATVTQGGKAVEDADEMKFEVWQSGHQDHSETVEGVHTDGGTYEAEVTLGEEGLYLVRAHTTARGLHVMPKKEIIVGNPDPASIEPDDSSSDGDSMPEEDHTSH